MKDWVAWSRRTGHTQHQPESDMNSKKAKALRRDARTYGASAPEVASVTLRNGQNINAPFSQRGLYRRLKQETKGLAPHGKDV